MTLSDCSLYGHNLEADPEHEPVQEGDIIHLHVRCKRCNHKMLLHMNEKNSL